MKLHEFLRMARESANITQMELAKKLGYTTAQFISNVERGVCGFPVDKLKTFIRITKCDRKTLKTLYVEHYEKELSEYL